MRSKIKWVLIVLLVVGNLFFLQRACKNIKLPLSEEKRVTFYVDSVWTKGPGQINTLQTDVIYFGRTTNGDVHSSRSRISVGDSFVYIYLRAR